MSARTGSSALVAAAALAVSLSGGGAPARAGEAEVLRDVKHLASDALEGRATGTSGGAAAADYIAKQLEAAGLAPRRDPFEFLAGVKVGPETALAVSGAAAAAEDFRPLGFSSNGRVEGDVVFGGYGITAPEAGWDDYAGADVKGKIVLVLDRVPGARNPHAPRRMSEGITRYGQVRYKAMNARERGAAALLVTSADPSGRKEDDPSLLPLTGATAHGDAGILVADLRRSFAARIVAAGGRPLDAIQDGLDGEGAKPAAVALAGVRASLVVSLVKEKRRAENVVAVRPGTDPDLAREAIVVGAHYDHLGRGEVGGSLAESPVGKEIHNGADDNASGTAALLDAARALPPTRRTVVFAAFSGEEMGLLGSAHYVKEPLAGVPPIASTVAMINMDMVGRLGSKKLTIGGMGTAEEWPGLVARAAGKAGIEFAGQDDGYGPSDHSSFYGKDVPVLFFFTGAHSDYHRPSDDWDKVDVTGTARIAGFAREVILAIDKLEVRPTHKKTGGTPHGTDLEPGRGPSVYLGTIPDYSETDVPGVRLSGVREGSPAEKAGLRSGDLIVRFDGKEVRGVHDYTYALFAKKPGDEVEIVVKRGAEEVKVKATLGRKGGAK